MPGLFDPFQVRGVTLRNRIVMAPMDMYATRGDGKATDWHLVHYGARALGGSGLMLVEVTAVERRGRIDEGDLGLWEDAQIEPLARLARFCAAQGATIGVQLGHAGRKAGGEHMGHWEDQLVGPSAVAFDDGWRTPHALTAAELTDVQESFGRAARRAVQAGFQVIELHGAHGYLISQFLSPLANQRSDSYGGDIRARARFGCEVVRAVREAIPGEMPLLVRVSGSDYAEGGNTIEEMAVAATLLRDAGADMIHVSSGGNSPHAPAQYPGYMVPLSEHIRREAGVPTIAVGRIWHPLMAEEIIRNERADLVALGRELLRHPHWPLYAAWELGVDVEWPRQYERAKTET